MAYNLRVIREQTAVLLESSPRLSLGAVARRLGVDRHTVERALKAEGMQFRDLQRELTLRAAARLRADGLPRSLKLAADQLGFPSAGALAQFLRRHADLRDLWRGGGGKCATNVIFCDQTYPGSPFRIRQNVT